MAIMHFKPAQLRASPPGMWLGDFCPAGKKRDFTTSLTFSGHAERKVEKFLKGKETEGMLSCSCLLHIMKYLLT